MLYGYEQIPQAAIYTPMLNNSILLYISAMREQYNQSREDYKDFLKEYGNFYSDSEIDNLNYYNMTQGAAENLIQLYGDNLLRTSAGRAAILKMISSVDRRAIANMKASAENIKEFVKNRDALAALGKYLKEWDEEYSNDMTDPTNWDSSKGVWTRISPSAYQSLHDLTKEEFEKMLAEELIGVEMGPDGAMYIKKGVSKETAGNALNAVMRKLDTIPGVNMYKNAIRKEVENDPNFSTLSADQINDEIQKRWAALLIREQAMYLLPKYEVSEAWKEQKALERTIAGKKQDNDTNGRYDQGTYYSQAFGANFINNGGTNTQSREERNQQITLMYQAINQNIINKKSGYFTNMGVDILPGHMMALTGLEDKMLEQKYMALDNNFGPIYSAHDLAYATATPENLRVKANQNGKTYLDDNGSWTAALQLLRANFNQNANLSGYNTDKKLRALVFSAVPKNGYINPTLANGLSVPFGRIKVTEIEITKDDNGKTTIREITDPNEMTPETYKKNSRLGIDKFGKDDRSSRSMVKKINSMNPMVRLIGAKDLNGNIVPSEAAAAAAVHSMMTQTVVPNSGIHNGAVPVNVR